MGYIEGSGERLSYPLFLGMHVFTYPDQEQCFPHFGPITGYLHLFIRYKLSYKWRGQVFCIVYTQHCAT